MSGNNDQLAKGCILVVFLGLACGLVGTGLALVGLGGVSQTATPPVVGGAPSPEPVAATPGQVPEPAAEPVNGPPSGAAVARIRARGVLLVGMDTGEPPYTGTPPMYVPRSSACRTSRSCTPSTPGSRSCCSTRRPRSTW